MKRSYFAGCRSLMAVCISHAKCCTLSNSFSTLLCNKARKLFCQSSTLGYYAGASFIKDWSAFSKLMSSLLRVRQGVAMTKMRNEYTHWFFSLFCSWTPFNRTSSKLSCPSTCCSRTIWVRNWSTGFQCVPKEQEFVFLSPLSLLFHQKCCQLWILFNHRKCFFVVSPAVSLLFSYWNSASQIRKQASKG